MKTLSSVLLVRLFVYETKVFWKAITCTAFIINRLSPLCFGIILHLKASSHSPLIIFHIITLEILNAN
jgi:hypothetical protein